MESQTKSLSFSPERKLGIELSQISKKKGEIYRQVQSRFSLFCPNYSTMKKTSEGYLKSSNLAWKSKNFRRKTKKAQILKKKIKIEPKKREKSKPQKIKNPKKNKKSQKETKMK